MKKTIAVLFGGRSCEHDISVITGLQAMCALEVKHYTVIPVYMLNGRFYTGNLKNVNVFKSFDKSRYAEVIFKNGCICYVEKRFKRSERVDCAVLCNHGGEGENGALQGYLEINDVPYTSAGVLQSAVGMDKEYTKLLLREFGLQTLPYVTLRKADNKNISDSVANVTQKIDFPMIVKPARQGSSIGISKAENPSALTSAIELAFYYDDKIIIEACLESFTEINCGAVRINGAICLGELEKPSCAKDLLSFSDKYLSGGKGMTAHELPARLPSCLEEEIYDITRTVYKKLDLCGVVRMDYLISEEGSVYLNELNTIPGSLAFYLFVGRGADYCTLLGGMIEEGIARFERKKAETRSFSSDVLKNYSGGGKLLNKK